MGTDMTVPTDFSSFAFGFNLTSAAYSGGAGGTFANLVAGQQNWTVNGGTPSFATRQGMEGMLFDGTAAQTILGQMRALHECTVIVTAQTDVAGNSYIFGNDPNQLGFIYGLGINAFRVIAFCGAGADATNTGFSAALNNSRPNVYVGSWSPHAGTVHVRINNGTPVVKTPTLGSSCRVGWPDCAIGTMANLYHTGWIGRVLVFGRALHDRDPSGLTNLVTSETALVGL
jgi:hypothetical protein